MTKINEKDIKYIERSEIYGNYSKYIEPIINYMASMDLPILNADSINEFIDSIIFNYYGFAEYNGKFYIVELWEEDISEMPEDSIYFSDNDTYILTPLELE